MPVNISFGPEDKDLDDYDGHASDYEGDDMDDIEDSVYEEIDPESELDDLDDEDDFFDEDDDLDEDMDDDSYYDEDEDSLEEDKSEARKDLWSNIDWDKD